MKLFFKKILIILFSNILFTNIVYSATFNWTKVAKAEDGSFEIFYDKKSVLRNGVNIYYWQMINNLKDIEDDIYSSISHNMANCDSYEMKPLTIVSFKSPMGRGPTDMELIIPKDAPDYFKWEYFDKKTTMQGLVLSDVCNQPGLQN